MVREIFLQFSNQIYEAVVSPERKSYIFVLCHVALCFEAYSKGYNLFFNNHDKRNQMILI